MLILHNGTIVTAEKEEVGTIIIEDGKIADGDLVGFIGGSFNDEIGATYLEFKYV